MPIIFSRFDYSFSTENKLPSSKGVNNLKDIILPLENLGYIVFSHKEQKRGIPSSILVGRKLEDGITYNLDELSQKIINDFTKITKKVGLDYRSGGSYSNYFL